PVPPVPAPALPPLPVPPLPPPPHTPAVQAAPPVHALPQAPQFAGSLEVSMQVPPQVALPAPQPQAPLLQVWPPRHLLPQKPQFVGSVATATQLFVLHTISPAAQLETHLLCEQSSPPVQAMAHAPQLAPSDAVFTQPVVQALR